MTKTSPNRRNIILQSGTDIVNEMVSILIKDWDGSSLCSDKSNNRLHLCPDFSHLAVVFPNRRPLYYLLNFLGRKIKKPFFPPHLFSIGEIASHISEQIKPSIDASRLDRIYILYEAAVSSGISEGTRLNLDFQSFALWAPRLLEIIEEMEMSMADYSRLKSISLMNEIPPAISEIVSRLPSIKQKYYENLHKYNRSTYPVRLKMFIDSDKSVSKFFPDVKKIYFCGFVQMTPLEKSFLDKLAQSSSGKNEFVEIIEVSVEPSSSWLMKSDGSEREIFVHSAFDVHSQAKKIKEILSPDMPNGSEEKKSFVSSGDEVADTAIIVPRADSLMPLLSEGLKEWDGKYNVSLGYPLSRTPVSSFLFLLMNIEENRTGLFERKLRLTDYIALVDHPYVRSVFLKNMYEKGSGLENFVDGKMLQGRRYVSEKEIVDLIRDKEVRDELERMNKILLAPFEKVNTLRQLSELMWEICSILIKESAAREHPFALEFLRRFAEILRDELPASLIADRIFEKKEVLFELFRTFIESEVLPFPGVPLEGLQILGLLECRNLSFRRLIVMDANEGVIPGIDPYDPLLPPSLRKVLNLPTYRDREELFRRNFMSMISSARQEVHLIYRSFAGEEPSRYIEEIIWEKEKKSQKILTDEKNFIKPVTIHYAVPSFFRKKIEKDPARYPDIILKEVALSASSIDRYLHCPVSFYYYNILGLRDENERKILNIEDETSGAAIGECIHNILREFFKKYPNKSHLSSPKARNEIVAITHREVEKNFGELTGEIYLLSEIISERLSKQFIDYELSRGNFTVIGVEEKYSSWFDVDGKNKVRIEGRIDRIDKRDDGIWLIDYKTGGYETPSEKNLTEGLSLDRKFLKKNLKSFQLPIYVWLYHSHNKNAISNSYPSAAYYSLKDMEEIPVFKERTYSRSDLMEKVYLPALKFILSEIIDTTKPFEPDDEDDERCRRCPYQTMCSQ